MNQRASESNTAMTAGGCAPGSDECTWALIAHLSAFAGVVVPLLGQIGGPLVIWLTRKDQSAFVASQAKEALNFNITVALAGFVFLMLVLLGIGILLLAVLYLAWFTLTIVAAIKAKEGIDYRYPLTLRLVR